MATLLILKNWGPSPAFHLVVDAGIVTDVGKLKKLLDISCNLAERVERGENNKLVSYGFGQPLFPETEMSQRAEVGDSLPHPNLTVLYLAGCIVYQDQFENLHHTPICLETTRLAKDFTMRDSFINCNGGRDAD